ncbi:MAG: DUF4838 domain-containing protein [Lentisphaerae bacterium]|jgi:hypothetical protein|nr:DUF4838 domain-containing protein [Lentisphaerota bacterium]MBT5606997.1 DUF4838 domain-containing protein [Lentisphaerota bacterium]MBT7056293.1 DUF4838 domain-containing protein [Lentisphaerota bacterium]MBT7844148.1 DUF4838 domain-containing protein [Lentisphaerota bacterium]
MRRWFGIRGTILLAGFVGCIMPGRVSAATLTLAQEGKTAYTIVEADTATEPEAYAAKELAEFLGRVTGATFPTVAESAAGGDAPRIYVGWTEFAASNGIDGAALGEEEWIIRTVGNDLILTGGRPRGTMYAVYEFLEDYVGCHWLDRKTEVIPSKPTLEIGSLNVQAKPAFWQRALGSPTGTPDDKWRFMIRNKNFRYDFRGRAASGFFPKGAFSRVASSRTSVHSFSIFVNGKDWFDSHPEYFSLVRGKRIPALSSAGPGQLCLTHPDVLKLTTEKLREFIAADRAEATANGLHPPKVYWINQNDVYAAHCECSGCRAIVEREGGESGPLIAFLNAVAQAIEADYPDVLVGTIAYNQTSPPPKHIRPRNNVLVGWCDVYSRCDGIRPLTHPYNTRNCKEITGWGRIAPRLAIGDDYWTALSYYKYFPTPYAMIDCVAADLKLFADLGVDSFYAETADYMDASQQFVPLKFWLAYQLLVDPHQPAEPLVKTFTDGYFGAAAGKMRDYLRYLRGRIDAEAQFKMLRDEPHKLAYLDRSFFQISETLFDEAEALVQAGGLQAKHIEVERFALDGALLFMWPWLERKLPAGETLPFERDTLIQRYERGWKSLISSRYSRVYTRHSLSLNKDGKLLERMLGLFQDPQLPEPFRDLPPHDIADFNWLTFSQIRPRQAFVPDDEATGGMTATFRELSRIQKAEKDGNKTGAAAEEQHRKPLTLGVTGGVTIALSPEQIPRDETYHLHSIGRIRIKPGTMVWALEGKRLGVNVDRVFVPGADDPAANDWNAHVSLKLQGPAYVKGSTKPNGAWMDRVLLVRPQPGEEVSEAYEQQLVEERRRAALRSSAKAPRLAEDAGGDPMKVNWVDAGGESRWWTLKGEQTGREVSAQFVHDGTWLYVRLQERMDSAKLVRDPGVWHGDDWELLFAAKRGVKPYRQLAVNPDSKFLELAYGEPEWKSGANVVSRTEQGAWTVGLALPLNRLVPGGAKPGQAIHVNILRGGKENLVWSPTFGDKFHALERFGEIVLE